MECIIILIFKLSCSIDNYVNPYEKSYVHFVKPLQTLSNIKYACVLQIVLVMQDVAFRNEDTDCHKHSIRNCVQKKYRIIFCCLKWFFYIPTLSNISSYIFIVAYYKYGNHVVYYSKCILFCRYWNVLKITEIVYCVIVSKDNKTW